MFSYEKWQVYKHAMELSKIASEVHRKLHKQLPAKELDNFCRAVNSISNNIAEGAGRFKRNEKIQFYQVGVGSAYEANNSAENLMKYIGPHPLLASVRPLTNAIAAALTNMIKAVENRDEGDEKKE